MTFVLHGKGLMSFAVGVIRLLNRTACAAIVIPIEVITGGRKNDRGMDHAGAGRLHHHF